MSSIISNVTIKKWQFDYRIIMPWNITPRKKDHTHQAIEINETLMYLEVSKWKIKNPIHILLHLPTQQNKIVCFFLGSRIANEVSYKKEKVNLRGWLEVNNQIYISLIIYFHIF